MAVKEAPTAALAPEPERGRLPAGGLTILAGFLTHGGAAAAGWTGYPPLAEQLGTGQDLWIVGLMLVGTASILGAINFIVTILRMRAPGMTMMRMPVFTWSILATSLLVLLAAPVLTAALIMRSEERRVGKEGGARCAPSHAI